MGSWLSFIHTQKSSPHCVTKSTLALLFYSMVNSHIRHVTTAMHMWVVGWFLWTRLSFSFCCFESNRAIRVTVRVCRGDTGRSAKSTRHCQVQQPASCRSSGSSQIFLRLQKSQLDTVRSSALLVEDNKFWFESDLSRMPKSDFSAIPTSICGDTEGVVLGVETGRSIGVVENLTLRSIGESVDIWGGDTARSSSSTSSSSSILSTPFSSSLVKAEEKEEDMVVR